MLKTIFARSCSTLLKKSKTHAPLTSTNSVRTCSSECIKRRAIKKAIDERHTKASTTKGMQKPNKLYVNDPYSQMDLLPLLCDTFVTFPALSPTMTSGEIFMWQKSEGDILLPGDVLAEIHTDRGIENFVTPAPGYLAKRVIKAGEQDVPVGSLMCIIVENKDDVELYEKNFINIYRIFSRSTIMNFEKRHTLKETKWWDDKMINKIE